MSLIQSKGVSGSTSDTATIAFDSNPGSSKCLFFFCHGYIDAGSSLTCSTTQSDTVTELEATGVNYDGADWFGVWIVEDSTGGATSAEFTHNGNTMWYTVVIMEFDGLVTTALVDVSDRSNASTNAPATATLSPGQAGTWVGGVAQDTANKTINSTSPPSVTLVYKEENQSQDMPIRVDYKLAYSTADDFAWSFNGGGVQSSALGAVLEEDAGGGPTYFNLERGIANGANRGIARGI